MFTGKNDGSSVVPNVIMILVLGIVLTVAAIGILRKFILAKEE